jgi:hypothetical protein
VIRRVELSMPSWGWDHPRPNAFEVAGALPTGCWALVGGLMVQAHAMLHDIRGLTQNRGNPC